MSKPTDESNRFALESNRRGVKLTTSGDLAGAIVELDRAIHFDPEFTEAFINRGAVRHLLGRNTQAVADFTRAIELDPDSVAAYCSRATVRLATWDFDGVVQDCDAALERSPDSATAHLLRGYAFYHKRDTERAESDYARSFELDPSRYVRAIVDQIQKSMRENPRAVLVDCDKHLKHDAGDFHSLARRGIARLVQGRTSEAEEDFVRYRELNPKGKERLAALIAEASRRGPSK